MFGDNYRINDLSFIKEKSILDEIYEAIHKFYKDNGFKPSEILILPTYWNELLKYCSYNFNFQPIFDYKTGYIKFYDMYLVQTFDLQEKFVLQ